MGIRKESLANPEERLEAKWLRIKYVDVIILGNNRG